MLAERPLWGNEVTAKSRIVFAKAFLD